MTIGDRIKLKRIECGLTQEDVAKALGTTKQTIYKYETGIVTNIPTDKIETLSKIFNTSPSYLTGWQELSLETDDEDLPEIRSIERDARKMEPEKRKQVLRMIKAAFDAAFSGDEDDDFDKTKL